MSLTSDGHSFPSAVITLTNVGWNYILANVGYRAEWSENACTYVENVHNISVNESTKCIQNKA